MRLATIFAAAVMHASGPDATVMHASGPDATVMHASGQDTVNRKDYLLLQYEIAVLKNRRRIYNWWPSGVVTG